MFAWYTERSLFGKVLIVVVAVIILYLIGFLLFAVGSDSVTPVWED